jgi:hypothetical protein
MPIPMEAPAKYIAEMAAGKVLRYGAILKDAGTGQIVGHLKETGQMSQLLSNIATLPLSSASIPIDVIGHAVTAYKINGVQNSVDQIQQTLQGLGLITNVAALSSIAGLGVSVAGFAAVNTKLNKIDTKLDGIADNVVAIKEVLKGLHEGWQAMSNAKLRKAAETILVAEQANSTERRLELAKDAVADFALLRQYYSNLLSAQGLFEDINLDVSHLHELTARYTFTCLGVLQAEFMTGDLGSYKKRLETICQEFPNLVNFSPKELFQARCDRLPALTLDHDYQAHSDSLVALSCYSTETAARIESHMVELEYLENNNLTVPEYLEALRDHETDVVLLPR